MSTFIDSPGDREEANTRRSRMLLIVLGTVFVLATVLGLWWARERPSTRTPRANGGTSPQAQIPGVQAPSVPNPQDGDRTLIAHSAASSAATMNPPVAQIPEVSGGDLQVTARWKDDGTPAVGIGVSAFGIQGAASSIRRSLETGLNGNVVFNDIPNGKWIVASAIGGRTEVDLPAGEEVACLLEIPTTRPVEGTVVDHRGFPVQGAHVWLSEGIGGHRPTCGSPTDAYGRFSIRSVGTASLIGAFAAGYAPSLVSDLSPVGHGPHKVTLVLEGRGGAVSGTVSSENDATIAFAEVCVDVGGPRVGSKTHGDTRSSPYPLTVYTDVDGRFDVLGVCPGRIGVSVRAPGHAPWNGWVEVKPEESTSIHVTLNHEGVLTGVVRTNAGVSVANAQISVIARSGSPNRTELSNAEGIYTIRGLGPGSVELRVDAGASGAATVHVELQPREKRTVDIVLEPGVMLVGRVINPAGIGLSGWAVYAGAQSGKQYSTVTSATGEFQIPCDDTAPLWLSVCDSIENTTPILILHDIVPGERIVICEIRLEDQRTAHITGRLLDANAAPGSNLQVRARKLDPPLVGLELRVLADAEGRFSVGPMQASRYALDAQNGDGSIHDLGEFALAPEQVLDIGTTKLQPSGSFAMSLRFASREPVREAVIHVRTASQYELVSRRYNLEIDGPLLVIDKLAPATYTVIVETTGQPTTTVEVVIRAGDRTDEYVVLGGP